MPDEVRDQQPYSEWLLWPDGRRGPWLVRVEWIVVDGRLECGGLEIRSYRNSRTDSTTRKVVDEEWPSELPLANESPEVLTATTLRKLPLGAILYDLRELGWKRTQKWASEMAAEGFEEFAADARRKADIDRGTRRRGVPPLSEVAAVYSQAVRQRDNPTDAVRAHWTVAHSTAAKWVMRARREKYLPPAKRRTGEGKRS